MDAPEARTRLHSHLWMRSIRAEVAGRIEEPRKDVAVVPADDAVEDGLDAVEDAAADAAHGVVNDSHRRLLCIRHRVDSGIHWAFDVVVVGFDGVVGIDWVDVD